MKKIKISLRFWGISLILTGIGLWVGLQTTPKPKLPQVEPDRVEALLCPTHEAENPAELPRRLAEQVRRIAEGDDVNTADDEGNTALILAARLHNRPAICWLVTCGADADIKNKAGFTAADYLRDEDLHDLLTACEQEEMPLSERAQSRYQLWHAEALADCSLGEGLILPTEASVRLKAGADVQQMLTVALNKGGDRLPELLAFLIRHGGDVVSVQQSMPHREEASDSIRYLLALGISGEGLSELPAPMSAPNSTQQTGVNEVDHEGRTPLFHAIMAHDDARVQQLLADGARTNLRDKANYTPLLLAIEQCAETLHGEGSRIVKLLLDAGADTEATRSAYGGERNALSLLCCMVSQFAGEPTFDRLRAPALEQTLQYLTNAGVRMIPHLLTLLPMGNRDYAVSPACARFATMLLDAGADPMALSPDGRGITSLMTAGSYSPELTRRLLEAGVDAKAHLKDGWTALHSAQSADVAERLLSAGGDLHAVSSWQDRGTPLRNAVKMSAEEALPKLAEFLIKQGADREGAAAGEARWDVISELAGRDLSADAFRKLVKICAADKQSLNAAWGSTQQPVSVILSTGAEPSEDLLLSPMYQKDVKELTAAGADINALDQEGNTPLMLLLQAPADPAIDREKLISLYLKHGALIDLPNLVEQTAVDLASGQDLLPLLKAGATPLPKHLRSAVRECFCRTPGFSGAQKLELLRLVISEDKNTLPADILTAIPAAEIPDADTACQAIEELLARGADINARDANGNSLLMNIIRTPYSAPLLSGKQKLIQTCISHGADITLTNPQKLNVIQLAGPHELTMLLAAGIKAAELLPQALDLCSRESVGGADQKLDMLRRIIEAQPEALPPDTLCKLPEGISAQGDFSLRVIELLLQKGALATAKDERGNTTLMLLGQSYAPITRLLLSRGADTQAVNSSGATALHGLQSAEVAQLLLSAGLDPNKADNDGSTPLHSAGAKVIPLLVAAGADTETTNCAGLTPLRSCLQQRRYDAAQALLQAHAKPKGSTANGSSWDAFSDLAAMEFESPAEQKKVRELARSLTQAGADINLSWESTSTYRAAVHSKIMLELGADPFYRLPDGRSTLMLRAASPTFLCRAGVDINAQDQSGNTALMHLLQIDFDDDKHIVDLIADYASLGARFDPRNKAGQHALQLAPTPRIKDALMAHGAREWLLPELAALICPAASPSEADALAGLREKVRAIQNGGDINALGEDDMSALMLAAKLNQKLTACWLIARKADVTTTNSRGQSAADFATGIALHELLTICAREHEALTAEEQNELSKHATTPEEANKALYEYQNYVEKLALLLKSGVNPERENTRTGAHLVENGITLESMAYLLRHGYPVNIRRKNGQLSAANYLTMTKAEDLSADLVRLLVACGLREESTKPVSTLIAVILCDDVKSFCELSKNTPQLIHDARAAEGAPLLSLAQSGEMVQALIDAGASVKQTSLLNYAVTRHASVAAALLKAGAPLPPADRLGNTLLHKALTAEMVHTLVEAGLDVNACNKGGETPLHTAAGEYRADVVEALIAHGADVNASQPRMGTPLRYVLRRIGYTSRVGSWVWLTHNPTWRAREEAKSQRPRLIDALLSAGAAPYPMLWQEALSTYGLPIETPHPSPEEDRQLVLTLLRHRVPIPKDILTYVHYSPYSDRLSGEERNWIATTLLSAGADPKAVRNAPEYGSISTLLTVGRHDPAIIRRLIAGGANPNIKDNKGRMPLHEVRTLAALEVYLKHKPDLEAVFQLGRYRLTPICAIASRADQTEAIPMVKRLLAAKAKVHGVDKEGNVWDIFQNFEFDEKIPKPLYRELAQLFIKAGADVNQALSQPTCYNHIEELIDLGADFTRADPKTGKTFLHNIFCDDLSEESFQALIRAGVDINAQDHEGNTPLMCAVHYNKENMVRLLLSGGARTDLRNKEGITALDIAERKRIKELIRLLAPKT